MHTREIIVLTPNNLDNHRRICVRYLHLALNTLRRTASLRTPLPTPISVSEYLNFDEPTYRNRLILLGLIFRPRAWYRVDDHRHVL